MQHLSNEFYHAAIKNAYPDADYITLPNISGKVARVFVFQTGNGTRVCRFNEQPIIARNYKITNMLYDYGFCVKPTTPHVYLGQYFESYDFDPHKTLSETLPYMSEAEINDAYKRALCIQAQLASFPVEKFNQVNNSHFLDVYNITMPHYVDNEFMRYLYRTLYKRLSTNANMCLIHCDLTPANILMSENRRDITHLIDFDSISICDENIAIFGMLRRYPLPNVEELIQYYQDVSGHNLNQREIMRMLTLFHKTRDLRARANTFTFKQH